MSVLLVLWMLFPNIRDAYIQHQASLLGINASEAVAAFEAIDSCFMVQQRSGFAYHTGVLSGGEPYKIFAGKMRCQFPSSAFLSDSTFLVIGSYTPNPEKTKAKRILHTSIYTRGSLSHFPMISLDYNPLEKTRSYQFFGDSGSIQFIIYEKMEG